MRRSRQSVWISQTGLPDSWSCVRTERIRQIAPWCSGSQDPENAIENTTAFTRGTPRALLGSIGLIAVYS